MLTFIDESGYPRPTDSTKNPILLGVCIHENDIKPITNQIYKLKDSIYGKQDEIKSTKLIREATITKKHTNNKAYVEGMVEWLVALFTKLHNLTENNFIPKSHYLEYSFQKMGKNFSQPVSEKFTTSNNDDESLLSEESSNDLSE